MTLRIFFAFILLALLCSCVQQKLFFGQNTVATVESSAPTTVDGIPMPVDQVKVFVVKESFVSKVDVKDDVVVLKDFKPSKGPDHIFGIVGGATSPKKELKGKYYYPEVDHVSDVKALKFLDTKPVLQGISIPLKIRPQLNNIALLDSFPSQTETGFNPALSFGWKLNLNIQRPKKDVFGKNLTTLSITPGWFLGTGAVDLSKSNTRNPKIEFARKAAIISTGGYIMAGFNNLNIGLSFGWDRATGRGSGTWLYQDELWYGVTLGFDVIK
jgi:hypothetical protein